jgi:hypothetical protein
MQQNNDELQHYGVMGMKWGVRRATYKMKSADSLRRGKEKIEKDLYKLEKKVNNKNRRASKNDEKAARAMDRGDFDKASKFMKKSAKQKRIAAKRGRTIIHNKKLLKLYDKRIQELDKQAVNTGRERAEKAIKDLG